MADDRSLVYEDDMRVRRRDVGAYLVDKLVIEITAHVWAKGELQLTKDRLHAVERQLLEKPTAADEGVITNLKADLEFTRTQLSSALQMINLLENGPGRIINPDPVERAARQAEEIKALEADLETIQKQNDALSEEVAKLRRTARRKKPIARKRR